MNILKIKVLDFLLVALLLTLCFTPIFFIGQSGKTAEISINGVVDYVLKLDEETTITLENIGTVIVKDGKIHIENTTCNDHSCEKTGEIYRSGQSIICLPNRLVIRISGNSEVDGIAQ